MTTCGEMLMEILQEYGVDTVFGIPGVHTLELYRGLQNSSMRHVTPRHEQGAGFMADGYARVCGKPGVCLIITGPGMTNIITAMGQAYGDSIPMLVISSTNAIGQQGLGEGHLHELPNQGELVSGVCAFSQTILRPADLPGVLARAFAVFNGARPRPVHIQIPIDVFALPADDVARGVPFHASPPGPSPDVIEQAADMLANAARPVMLLGGGSKNAHIEARAVAERLASPVGLTINSKGLLPKGHPLSCGSFIPYGPMCEALAEADVVLAVGTEMGETDYDVYRTGNVKIPGKLIRLDIEPDQTARNYHADLSIICDARYGLDALHTALKDRGVQNDLDEASARCAVILEDSKKEIYDITYQFMPWYDAIDEASKGTDSTPIIVGDSAQPIYAANHCYEARQPRSYFTSSSGYGTLGFGLPASLGARLAAPHRPVVCVVGDGGILFSISELATAVEARIGVAILLWNNKSYKTIKDYMIASKIEPTGCLEYTPDFLAIAKGFGCETDSVDTPQALTTALKAAYERDVPTLIEVMAALSSW
ncbi:MAG: 5-guanidino-2-oxopentanoate decarboxylase [Gammaproteobacteria bacterium]|nr:5-guanidino-2-oxopentanoate decarboxylase [Gammaproteobacteria bacterium]